MFLSVQDANRLKAQVAFYACSITCSSLRYQTFFRICSRAHTIVTRRNIRIFGFSELHEGNVGELGAVASFGIYNPTPSYERFLSSCLVNVSSKCTTIIFMASTPAARYSSTSLSSGLHSQIRRLDRSRHGHTHALSSNYPIRVSRRLLLYSQHQELAESKLSTTLNL